MTAMLNANDDDDTNGEGDGQNGMINDYHNFSMNEPLVVPEPVYVYAGRSQ